MAAGSSVGAPMGRLLIVVLLAAAAGVVALAIQRRSRPAAPVRTGWTVPDQLDRADFARPDAAWLVVLFSSATCESCQGTWQKVAALESSAVAVEDVAYQANRDRHERYGIDAVPLVLVADGLGVVRTSFVGPPSAADLWASLAELRAPGSVPSGCDHHGSV
jgi:hypothetical protein